MGKKFYLNKEGFSELTLARRTSVSEKNSISMVSLNLERFTSSHSLQFSDLAMAFDSDFNLDFGFGGDGYDGRGLYSSYDYFTEPWVDSTPALSAAPAPPAAPPPARGSPHPLHQRASSAGVPGLDVHFAHWPAELVAVPTPAVSGTHHS
jgi:hypothetical protein